MPKIPASGFRGILVAVLSVVSTSATHEAFAQAHRIVPPALVNTMLDSLERVALTSPEADQRRAAITRISAAGWTRRGPDSAVSLPPYPGIVARLARIYRQTDDWSVRHAIMSLIIPQAERAEAVAFLAEVAREPPAQAPPEGVFLDAPPSPLPAEAVGALTRMGPEGRAALQRLHNEGAVREPTARVYLDRLAQQGFHKKP